MVTNISEITSPSQTLSFKDYKNGLDFEVIGYPNLGDIWNSCLDWHPVNLDAYPTEQNMVDWENERLLYLSQVESDKEIIINEIELYTLTRNDYVLAYQLLNQLNRVFVDGNIGNPTQSVLYSGFVSAINGTNLEQPIRDKVLAFTGLTDFATPTNLEKERIMISAEIFLQTLVTIGLIKQFI